MKYSDAEVNLIVISVMIPMFVLIALIYYFIMLPKSSRIKFNKEVTWTYGNGSSYDFNKVIPMRTSICGVTEKKELTAASADSDINNTAAAVNYVREFSDVAS